MTEEYKYLYFHETINTDDIYNMKTINENVIIYKDNIFINMHVFNYDVLYDVEWRIVCEDKYKKHIDHIYFYTSPYNKLRIFDKLEGKMSFTKDNPFPRFQHLNYEIGFCAVLKKTEDLQETLEQHSIRFEMKYTNGRLLDNKKMRVCKTIHKYLIEEKEYYAIGDQLRPIEDNTKTKVSMILHSHIIDGKEHHSICDQLRLNETKNKN